MNSRDKGKRGELELAHWLLDRGIQARRGHQSGKGAADNPDVVHDIPGLHLEAKRVESLNFYAALRQATADAGGLVPVVAHRRNNAGWTAYLPLEFLINPPAEFVEWLAARVLWRVK